MSEWDQVASLPRFFRIGSDLVHDIAGILAEAGVQAGVVLISSGAVVSRRVADVIATALPPGTHAHQHRVLDSSDEAVESLYLEARRVGAQVVVSVGGGGVQDVGKRLQRLHGVPNVAVPTIISNDGLVSPIAVLTDAKGVRRSVPASVPCGLVVDLRIIRDAPRRYLVAAAGDILSNVSASHDWRRLHRTVGRAADFNDLAFEMAIGAAESLVASSRHDWNDEALVALVVRAQLYSGLAMSIAGTSRPCSGAEHLLSHAIDHLGLATDQLHGTQVGSLALFVLYLLEGLEERSARLEECVAFASRIGIPVDWLDLSPDLAPAMEEIVATSRLMRPERRTILDHFSDAQIIEAARNWRRFERARASGRG